MEFRIAESFTDSLARLNGHEQKAVKTTAFDLQLNPAHPSMQFHRIEKTRDENFWSVRVNQDIRIIVHKSASSLLLCYVNHHDDAYAWARRRKIETHPRTGAAQLVEIRERVEEQVPSRAIATQPAPPTPPAPPLFAHIDSSKLLGYGVPTEWLDDVQQADEENLFDLLEHLPEEAAEALLELATGNEPVTLETTILADAAVPEPPVQPALDQAAFAHPDAQRRFRVIQNVEELERALDYPWERWTIFLHPAQRRLVERAYSGPTRIAGSAGTGKTIVALHRAVFLARRHPQAQVVLLTFSLALANALHHKMVRLVGNEPAVRERIRIYTTREFAHDLYTEALGPPALVQPTQLREMLVQAAQGAAPHPFSEQFLLNEWHEVVDVWQVASWEHYRDVPRLGRKTRIGGRQREALWAIFAQVQQHLKQQGLLTWPMLLRRVAAHLLERDERPFDYAIVDEAQDLDVAELRFLAMLGDRHAESLFFSGDLGQRIFQQPFSWKTAGVDIRGRSHILTINYRTSHQIRQQADRLLPISLADVDGNVEERGTISMFNGPPPQIAIFDDPQAEAQAVADWLAARLAEGAQPHEIGVFVRSAAQLARARTAVQQAGASATELDEQVLPAEQCIALSTMHLAKGLEFRAVAVMACDDDILPAQERISRVSDESDLEDVYNTERYLLYVACTRARDHLLVTGVEPASEFLEDMEQG